MSHELAAYLSIFNLFKLIELWPYYQNHVNQIILNYIMNIRGHTGSHGTDPPKQITTQQFFLPPQALENLASPTRQTKFLDNFNTLHMFNNNTYPDFRRAYKHILISSYVIQLIQQNQNVTKLNINWLCG